MSFSTNASASLNQRSSSSTLRRRNQLSRNIRNEEDENDKPLTANSSSFQDSSPQRVETTRFRCSRTFGVIFCGSTCCGPVAASYGILLSLLFLFQLLFLSGITTSFILTFTAFTILDQTDTANLDCWQCPPSIPTGEYLTVVDGRLMMDVLLRLEIWLPATAPAVAYYTGDGLTFNSILYSAVPSIAGSDHAEISEGKKGRGKIPVSPEWYAFIQNVEIHFARDFSRQRGHKEKTRESNLENLFEIKTGAPDPPVFPLTGAVHPSKRPFLAPLRRDAKNESVPEPSAGQAWRARSVRVPVNITGNQMSWLQSSIQKSLIELAAHSSVSQLNAGSQSHYSFQFSADDLKTENPLNGTRLTPGRTVVGNLGIGLDSYIGTGPCYEAIMADCALFGYSIFSYTVRDVYPCSFCTFFPKQSYTFNFLVPCTNETITAGKELLRN